MKEMSENGLHAIPFRMMVLFACVALCSMGCDSVTEGYDPALRYPSRTDALVVQLPTTFPTHPAPPGKLDQVIRDLPAIGGRIADPGKLDDANRQQLTTTLEAMFGTPAAPKLAIASVPAQLGDIALSPEALAEGSRNYRRLCSQCHGLTGDGRGVTGPWIYPHPRDFRQGVFKASFGHPKPTTDSMVTILRRGITGSSMPLFDLISDQEVRTILAYTIHLSIRGEVEFHLMRDLLDQTGERFVDDIAAECERQAARSVREWVESQSVSLPAVVETNEAESIRRGYALFTQTAGCASCHQDFGRTESYRFDVWGTADRVTDLTQGKFRWSRDAAELEARIRHGIPAVGMPSNPNLTEAQVRDLAAFVREIGYPQRLPDDVRSRVYPPTLASGLK